MALLLQQMNRGPFGQFLNGNPVFLWSRHYLNTVKVKKPCLTQYFSCCSRPALRPSGNIRIYQPTLRFQLSFNGKHIQNAVLKTYCRQIHLTSRKEIGIPPLIWLIVSFTSKATAVLTGRTWRNWLKKQPLDVQRKHASRLLKIFLSIFGVGGCIGSYYYYTHLIEAPVSGRKRFIVVTKEQSVKISNYESEVYLESYKDQLVPATSPVYNMVLQVARRLVHHNQDFPGMKEHAWTIHVIEDKTRNAFVFPNGHIFVFTGLLEFSENPDQFAVTLGHEMAHALLSHGAEQLSRSKLLDYVVIGVMAFIWFLMPSDGIAVVANWFYNRVMNLAVHLPYSRTLELEADQVGLLLAAKACFDVREASVIWKRMMIIDDISGEPKGAEWLSTHPSYDTRMKKLNGLIPEALDEREKCKCPLLPAVDPRNRLEHFSKIADTVKAHRAARANLERVSPKRNTVPTYQPTQRAGFIASESGLNASETILTSSETGPMASEPAQHLPSSPIDSSKQQTNVSPSDAAPPTPAKVPSTPTPAKPVAPQGS